MALDLFRRRSTKPPNPEAAAKGRANNPLFQPKHVAQAARVNTQLAAIEQKIAVAEAALPAIALQSVLDDNHDAGQAAVAKLAQLRERRDVLRQAHAAVTAAEQERLTGLKSKADRARERARAQHTGELERQATSVASDLVALRTSFRKMVTAADGIQKNLPSHLTGHIREGIEGALSEKNLRMLVDVAAYFGSRDGVAAPGCGERPKGLRFIENHYNSDMTGYAPPLAQMVSDLVLGALKSKPATPTEIAVVPPAADALAPAVSQPAVGGDAAPVHFGVRPAPITGVAINSRGNTDLTEYLPPPSPYVPETDTEPVDEQIDDVVTGEAPEEIVSQAGFVAPPYTEASKAL